MKYFFHFKWGGCPKTLEKPYDPCSQPDWTIPRNLYEGLQIENPGTSPETILQSFDWNRDYIKTKAIERIKKHTKTDDSLQIVSESKRSVPAMYFTEKTQTSDTETSEEKKQNITPGANTQPPNPAANTQATAPQATNTPKYRITHCTTTVELFPRQKPIKNRRFTPSEREMEKQVARAFRRPERHFFYDMPYYPYCKPEPLVNFHLGYKM